jgi:hypothetical protein
MISTRCGIPLIGPVANLWAGLAPVEEAELLHAGTTSVAAHTYTRKPALSAPEHLAVCPGPQHTSVTLGNAPRICLRRASELRRTRGAPKAVRRHFKTRIAAPWSATTSRRRSMSSLRPPFRCLMIVAVASIALLVMPVVLTAQERLAPYCTGIAAAEATGYVALPRGNVFCPLVADPKQPRSFVSIVRESEVFDTELAALGVGDALGLARWGGREPGNGVQISIVAAVFAQFDLRTASYDILNTDFIIGVPVTARYGSFSLMVRPYHQSSHLGDEFLLGTDIERENLSFESLQLLLSQEIGLLRIYGGGERLFNRDPADLEPLVVLGGVELRPMQQLEIGSVSRLGLIAGVDVKVTEQQAWKPAWSARAGLEFGRPHDGRNPARRALLLFEYYDGPTPYGQFFRDGMRYLGVGVHITLL